MEMSLWKACLIVLGVFIIMVAAFLVGVIKIFPKYAEGEAVAVVKARYPAYESSSLDADYQGEGRWQVTNGVRSQDDGSTVHAHFLVYEETNTVEIFEDESLNVALGSPAPAGRSTTPYFVALAANVVIFIAHVLFAVIFWSGKRRTAVAQAKSNQKRPL